MALSMAGWTALRRAANLDGVMEMSSAGLKAVKRAG